MRARSRRENWLAVVLLRVSRRDLSFCLTALLIFCLGSVLYQFNGGAPKILLDVGYYIGKKDLKHIRRHGVSCHNEEDYYQGKRVVLL